MVLILFLNYFFFREFFSWVEEEFGFNYLMGGLIIFCREEVFFDFIVFWL